jgi:hypothetical protein
LADSDAPPSLAPSPFCQAALGGLMYLMGSLGLKSGLDALVCSKSGPTAK